ncbi:MAG: hypothetical protein AAB798_00570 [Patescibacteria group bacterium]|mgnify:CR=1 FL=1
MTTISVPISGAQEKFINDLVKSGKAANKAHAVRYALDLFAEDMAVEAVLEAEQEIARGKGLRDDIDTIAKKYARS